MMGDEPRHQTGEQSGHATPILDGNRNRDADHADDPRTGTVERLTRQRRKER